MGFERHEAVCVHANLHKKSFDYVPAHIQHSRVEVEQVKDLLVVYLTVRAADSESNFLHLRYLPNSVVQIAHRAGNQPV